MRQIWQIFTMRWIIIAFILYQQFISVRTEEPECDVRKHKNCNFTENFCYWRNSSWYVSEGKARINTGKKNKGYLLSSPLCEKEESNHCLQFKYSFNNVGVGEVLLSVIKISRDSRITLWNLTSHGKSALSSGRASLPVTIKTSNSTISIEMLRLSKPNKQSYITVDNISYQESYCTILPPEAEVTTPILVTLSESTDCPTQTEDLPLYTSSTVTRTVTPEISFTATADHRTDSIAGSIRIWLSGLAPKDCKHKWLPLPMFSQGRREASFRMYHLLIVCVAAFIIGIVLCGCEVFLRQRKTCSSSPAADVMSEHNECLGAARGSTHYEQLDSETVTYAVANRRSRILAEHVSTADSLAAPCVDSPIYATVNKERKGDNQTLTREVERTEVDILENRPELPDMEVYNTLNSRGAHGQAKLATEKEGNLYSHINQSVIK